MDEAGYGFGGGVYVGNDVTSASFSHSTIAGNQAKYGGGGIWVEVPKPNVNPTITLNDTWVVANTAGDEGGGIGVRQLLTGGTPSLVLTGNTWIAFNTTTNANSKGGGLFLGRGSVTLSGVTFESNSATYGDGLYACEGTQGIQGPGGVTYIDDTWYEE